MTAAVDPGPGGSGREGTTGDAGRNTMNAITTRTLIAVLLSVIATLLLAILIVVVVNRRQPETTPSSITAGQVLDKILSSEPPTPMSFEQSKVRATNAQLIAFEQQIDIFELDVHQYPSTQQGLEALHTVPLDLPDKSMWKGPYAKNGIPPDPWGNVYRYELLTPKEYKVYSVGPDGEPSTADDVVLAPIQ
jgi:type II secretion system protein G